MKTATLNRAWQTARRMSLETRARGITVTTALMLAAFNLFASPTVNWISGGPNPDESGVSAQGAGFSDGDITLEAEYHTPCGLAIDNSGNHLFVADRDNNTVRWLQFNQNQAYHIEFDDQNDKAITNIFNKPVGVALGNSGTMLYVLNRGTGANGSVLSMQVDLANGLIGTLATNLTKITNAAGIALDSVGDIFVTASNRVFKVAPNGVSNVVATVFTPGTSLSGIVVKHNGLLAVCDSGRNGILIIDPNSGLVTTNAGFHGKGDFASANNAASSNSAKFFMPSGVVEAGDGTLIVSDYGNHRVKAVLTSGIVTNLYGVTSNDWVNPYKGFVDGTVVVPDQIGGVAARLPNGVLFAPDGSLYVTEDYYHIIRHVTGTGLPTPPPPPPIAPTILTVVTNYFQVSLTWSAVNGATSYNLKRSTGTTSAPNTNGPFTIIANVATASFTDIVPFNGVYYSYVVSAVNAANEEGPNSAVVSTRPPLPPVPDPQIGYVDFPSTSTPISYTSVFYQQSSFQFYNDAYIIIKGTTGSGTYYTVDGTDPTTNSSSVSSDYVDGKTSPSQLYSYLVSPVSSPFSPYLVTQPTPSLTIKAIGTKNDGSPNSAVATATFQFITGNPTIIGNNAAQFFISDITAGAHLYYTLDNSTPSSTNGIDLGTVATSSNLWTVGFNITSNIIFKVIAVRPNFQDSAVVSATFSPSNLVANVISFGFASGEASSVFIASPGQTFYAPVTLSLLPSVAMYSLQFNLTVTNAGPQPGPSVAANAFGFNSFLQKPIPGTSPVVFTNIPPALFVSGGFTNGIFTNSSLNLMGVSWLERGGATNLYDTTKQDLITYSEAHDVQYLSAGGKVEVGGYQFTVPATAAPGDTYQIQIGRPSATSDGVGGPNSAVYISASTNGPLGAGGMNALKTVTVGQIKYVVGDVYPFGWFNAGDFGKGYLNNADVEQVFETAIYEVGPPAINAPGSDFLDAMDSCGYTYIDNGNGYLEKNTLVNNTSVLFDGNDTNIDQIAFGDGQLDVCDVYVTLRRSLDPSRTWFHRFWTNGVRVADINITNAVPNIAIRGKSAVQSKVQAKDGFTATNSPQVNFTAGDAVVTFGHTVQIPITANVFGGYPLRVLMLNLTVTPLDGSPALTTPVHFSQNASVLGAPYTSDSIGNGNYSAAWLNSTNAGLTGATVIGTLIVTLPANTTGSSAYAIHFDHASASPNGLASFPKSTFTGLITGSTRNTSSYGDGIPDSWRLRWFGTVNNYLSVSNADADGDGCNNWQEYVAGTDPTDPKSNLHVAANPVAKGQPGSIQWPSVAGKTYVIQRSTTLFPANWTPVSTNAGTGTTMQFNDTATGKVYFYRVQVH